MSDIRRSVFTTSDLLSETTVALTARPARTLLTALGTILGIAALVATLGLSKTAGNQIVSRFNELEATQVVVTPREQSGGSNTRQISVIPFDAGDRMERLNGVNAAGTSSPIATDDLARSVPVIDPVGQNEFQIPVIAASSGLFEAVRAELAAGRYFDNGHDARGDNVVVLGPGAAQRLNITRIDNTPAIFVGEDTFTVIGILADVEREPELLSAIIITNGYAKQRLGLAAPARVVIDVQIGAAELIGSQAALALAPDNPELLQVGVPPSPRAVRDSVQSDFNALFLILGAVSLLAGAIGIANVTLVSVLERTPEIGLRRALGARRSHIAKQFLFESAALGALAGVVGTSVGVLTVVAISAMRTWTPVLDTWLPLGAPAVSTAIGLIAGTYPAWKASAIEPIAALRAGSS